MKCRISGPTLDLLSQHLCFNKIPKEFVCTFKFGKPCPRAVVLSRGCLEQPSKILVYLIWDVTWAFFFSFLFEAPQVILIAARNENHCFGRWGAVASLNRVWLWDRRARNCRCPLFAGSGSSSLALAPKGPLSSPVTVLLPYA